MFRRVGYVAENLVGINVPNAKWLMGTLARRGSLEALLAQQLLDDLLNLDPLQSVCSCCIMVVPAAVAGGRPPHKSHMMMIFTSSHYATIIVMIVSAGGSNSTICYAAAAAQIFRGGVMNIISRHMYFACS